jgi:hypothetical protein
LVKPGRRKELKEVEIIATEEALQLRTNHAFGISIISLSTEDALQLRDEIEEWLSEHPMQSQKAKTDYLPSER